eukprot:tig00020904_g15152.t1
MVEPRNEAQKLREEILAAKISRRCHQQKRTGVFYALVGVARDEEDLAPVELLDHDLLRVFELIVERGKKENSLPEAHRLLCAAMRVSRRWHRLASQPHLWSTFHLRAHAVQLPWAFNALATLPRFRSLAHLSLDIFDTSADDIVPHGQLQLVKDSFAFGIESGRCLVPCNGGSGLPPLSRVRSLALRLFHFPRLRWLRSASAEGTEGLSRLLDGLVPDPGDAGESEPEGARPVAVSDLEVRDVDFGAGAQFGVAGGRPPAELLRACLERTRPRALLLARCTGLRHLGHALAIAPSSSVLKLSLGSSTLSLLRLEDLLWISSCPASVRVLTLEFDPRALYKFAAVAHLILAALHLPALRRLVCRGGPQGVALLGAGRRPGGAGAGGPDRDPVAIVEKPCRAPRPRDRGAGPDPWLRYSFLVSYMLCDWGLDPAISIPGAARDRVQQFAGEEPGSDAESDIDAELGPDPRAADPEAGVSDQAGARDPGRADEGSGEDDDGCSLAEELEFELRDVPDTFLAID